MGGGTATPRPPGPAKSRGAAATPAAEPLACIVVSLRRTPERLQQFMARNRLTGLPFEVFEAVDGSALDLVTLWREGLVEPGVNWFTSGAIGNALSHRTLWRRCVETHTTMAVFEDDVFIRRDFTAALGRLARWMPAAWDILLLGYNTDYPIDVGLAPGFDCWISCSEYHPAPRQLLEFARTTVPVAALPLGNAMANCAYLISPRGARKLLESCFPLRPLAVDYPSAGHKGALMVSIDGALNSQYRSMTALICVPPLALSPNDHGSSTVREF